MAGGNGRPRKPISGYRDHRISSRGRSLFSRPKGGCVRLYSLEYISVWLHSLRTGSADRYWVVLHGALSLHIVPDQSKAKFNQRYYEGLSPSEMDAVILRQVRNDAALLSVPDATPPVNLSHWGANNSPQELLGDALGEKIATLTSGVGLGDLALLGFGQNLSRDLIELYEILLPIAGSNARAASAAAATPISMLRISQKVYLESVHIFPFLRRAAVSNGEHALNWDL